MNIVVQGGELSCFTRRLEAACTFYGLPFEMKDKATHDPELCAVPDHCDLAGLEDIGRSGRITWLGNNLTAAE